MPHESAMKERYYLSDVLDLLLERAREARGRHASLALDPVAREFEAGRVMAYYEVLSTLIDQLGVFEIPPATVKWDAQLNLEADLLGGLGADRHGA